MASTSTASGSAMGDTNTGSLLLRRVANRSRLGVSHAMHSASNTEWKRVHSVCTILSILERRSANAFLSPGMCLASRVICASRARISTSRVRRYRGTDTVPPAVVCRTPRRHCPTSAEQWDLPAAPGRHVRRTAPPASLGDWCAEWPPSSTNSHSPDHMFVQMGSPTRLGRRGRN